MLRTHFCELLGIEAPIIQAAISPFTSAELVAAVSNAGGLGSVGTAMYPLEAIRRQLERTRELTDRPFVVNFTITAFAEEAFPLALAARPSAISLATGHPGNLIQRIHDAGILAIHQVHTVQQAYEAAHAGADVIIAQGTEAGGFGGVVAALPLIPQVVDAVHPIPVVAAGGIADGRGLAAALTLGAQGVNVGTRFLASRECPASEDWKHRIVTSQSEETLKADIANDIFPPPAGAYEVSPRALRTGFVEQWQQRREEARRESDRLRVEVVGAIREGRLHELMPFSGQTVGLIHEVLPAAEIVRRMVAEAEEAIEKVAGLRRQIERDQERRAA